MKSPIVKRSIVIGGHKTSVSLEDAFWQGLKEISHGQHLTLSNMVSNIDRVRQQSNLSSAIRLFVLDRLRTQSSGDVTKHVEAKMLNGGSIETRV
jgi:predicted DNA-binding ribbon-helix-helix protein